MSDYSRLITPVQRMVLERICCQGMDRQSAATDLNISHQTIKNHLTDIFLRLGFKNIARTCYEFGQGRVKSK